MLEEQKVGKEERKWGAMRAGRIEGGKCTTAVVTFYDTVRRRASDKHRHTGQASGFAKIREFRGTGYMRYLLAAGDSDGIRRRYLPVQADGLAYRFLGDPIDRLRRTHCARLVLRL